jgi:hypothetical protein
MRQGKRILNVGRWRIAVMYGGRYRLGAQIKTLMGRRVGFTAGLGLCVLSVFRRAR